MVAKKGSKPIFIASLVVLGGSMASISLVNTLEQLVMSRVVGGVALSGVVAAILAGVYDYL